MHSYAYSESSLAPNDEDNVIAALKHLDRMWGVRLLVTGLQLEKMVKVMQEPFPVLTCLEIFSEDGNAPVLPAEFMGGSAPCLRSITLSGVPYPALSTLLLSTRNLVALDLHHIPPTGYISPKAMVACLAASPGLKIFNIEFQSATSRPDRIRPPPITRTVLPALTSFRFRAASEYLEDLVARIDSPQLNLISILYLNQAFQVAQLSKFIGRLVGPELNPLRPVFVGLSSGRVDLTLYRHANYPGLNRHLDIIISCGTSDWQVSHMTQVLSQFSATFSTVVHLELTAKIEAHRLEGTGDFEWLHFLHQFSTVQTLHVSPRFARRVAPVLENITEEMVAEVFPSLDLICLESQPASSVEKFVAARRLSGRPVTVVNNRAEFNQRL